MKKILLFFVVFFFKITPGFAGWFELSANGSYYVYNNGESFDSGGNSLGYQSKTTSYRVGGSFGYHFMTNTSIEISYSASSSVDKFAVLPDGEPDAIVISRTTILKNTSLDLVLDFFGKEARFRPYIRGGIGYMVRDVTIEANELESGVRRAGYESSSEGESISANAGVGIKYFVAESVALELTYTTFAFDLSADEVLLNTAVTGGLRIIF